MKNDKDVHDLLGTVDSNIELFVVHRLQVCADGSTGTVPVPVLCAMMMTVVSENQISRTRVELAPRRS